MKKKGLKKTVQLFALLVTLLILMGTGVSWAADADGDGIDDANDNCPTISNYWQRDTDGDGTGDACDTTPGCGGSGQPSCEYFDTDGDGIENRFDNCPTVANPLQSDADGDTIGDACDATPGCGTGCGQPACEGSLNVDTDKDFVRDGIDNCPTDCNQYQLDADVDGKGDVCDPDPGCGGSGQPACEEGCINNPPVVVTADETIAAKFDRYTVTGIRTPVPVLPEVPGFKGASYLSIGDLDGDGKKEIVATSGVGVDADMFTLDGAVAVFTQGANLDSWTQSIIYPRQTTGLLGFANETVLKDMDGDDDLDIMVMDNFFTLTDNPAGLYCLENKSGPGHPITDNASWVIHTIYRGVDGEGLVTDWGCYHRSRFLDVDGDGLEDIITTKANLALGAAYQYVWMEWWKKNDDGDIASYAGPYEIGNGGGSLFDLIDVDKDGDLDIVAPQFAITESLLSHIIWADERGDSFIWFENPGTGGAVTELWDRYTIDNWYTSQNPLGKGNEVVTADFDNDGRVELLFTNHNHQGAYSTGGRIWPSGVYYFGIPGDPRTTANWKPITIDSGDPAAPVTNINLTDTFGVDRPGGASQQGSPGMVRVGDISGDGYLDIVVPGDGKGAVYYYESQGRSLGKLLFKRAKLYSNAKSMPGDAQIVDIDGDGQLEIVSAIYDTSTVKTYPCQSSSIFIFKLK